MASGRERLFSQVQDLLAKRCQAALGNGLAGRVGARLVRPARAYAMIELLVAAAGAGRLCSWQAAGRR